MSQSICDLACDILRATNDGNQLSREDLCVVQCAVNAQLSENGEVYFYDLHKRCTKEAYKKPWFHSQEHLTIDHDGYVYWREKNIEHFSYRNKTEEKEAAKQLASDCQTLEKNNVRVCWSNLWALYDGRKIEK